MFLPVGIVIIQEFVVEGDFKVRVVGNDVVVSCTAVEYPLSDV